MQENQYHLCMLLTKPPRAILRYTVSNFFFFFWNSQKNEFIYFYRNDFLIFGALVGGAFRTMRECVNKRYPEFSIFSQNLLLCCLCKNISYNFYELTEVDPSFLYTSQTYFIKILNFLVILMAVKHPNQPPVIKLCLKKGINSGVAG